MANQDPKIASLYMAAHRARSQARIIATTTWNPPQPEIKNLLTLTLTLAKLLDEVCDALMAVSE